MCSTTTSANLRRGSASCSCAFTVATNYPNRYITTAAGKPGRMTSSDWTIRRTKNETLAQKKSPDLAVRTHRKITCLKYFQLQFYSRRAADSMIAPDHATFDFYRYMNQLDAEPVSDNGVYDTDGNPMESGETYWDVDGSYIPTNEDSMHDYLDSQAEDYGRPINYDYDNLAGILEEFKDAEVISWM